MIYIGFNVLVFKRGAEVLHQFRSFDQFGLPSLWGALLCLGARRPREQVFVTSGNMGDDCSCCNEICDDELAF